MSSLESNSENGAAAAPATDKPSETQQILKELHAAIDGGADLTNKETRVRVCHEVETRLKVPYGNVTKQVNRALKEAAQKAGAPPSSVKRNFGGSSAEVKLPPLAQAEQAAASTEPAAATAPTGQTAAPQPAAGATTNAILAKYSTVEELMQGPEYMQLYLTYYSLFSEVHGMYAQIGIPVKADFITMRSVGSDGKPKEQQIERTAHLASQWALAHIKFNWNFPGWMEKGLLIGGTVFALGMPALVHFGIIDDIKSGFGKKKDDKKKAEPEKSEKPL